MGLLTGCSILSAIGLFALSSATTPALAFVAATISASARATGPPCSENVTSERFLRAAPLLMAIVGGAGMLSVASSSGHGRRFPPARCRVPLRGRAAHPAHVRPSALFLYYWPGGYKAIVIGAGQPTA
jgi:nitrate/nitrite transporter NarK